IIFRDKSGRIDYLNEQAEIVMGLKSEELKGKKFNDPQFTVCNLKGNPLSEEQQSFGLVEKSLKPLYGLEQLLKWPDGNIKFISLNVAPIIDDNGVMQGTVASFSDITEQKLEEQERERLYLLEKEQSRRIVLENKMIYDLISEEDFSSKLTHVLEIIAQIMPHDGSDITLLDNNRIDVIAIYGYKDSASHDIVKNLRKNLNSYTVEQVVMLNKTPIFIPDTNQESRWVKTPGFEWIRSAMKIPLVFEGKALGTIGFTSEKLNAFNEESLSKIESFVHGLSIVIHNHQNYQQLLKTRNDIISTITKLVEIRDPYTHGHQEEVSKLATAIAQEMGLDKNTIETIRVASLVHDIGKTIIPSEILNKPGKLTELEYGLVKHHAQSGYEILKDISFTSPIAEIVYQHHEKINGSGYPRGLKGNEIMLEARILLVADVYEAMSSHRPYRPALSRTETEEELEKNKGILYDPEVVDACLKVIRRNPVLSPPVLPD
ncbi:MAG TPA: HD domain-containing phosphohydrolase, partial [Atribacterota bacterium]|nr:HD domain-containing phosphohydrolase [Atribacterota bacterium]